MARLRGITTFFFIACVLLGGAGSAAAQDEGSAPREVPDATRRLVLPARSFDYLKTLWRFRRQALEDGDRGRAQEIFERVSEQRLENGIASLDAFAASLIREARLAWETENSAEATKLLDQAEKIAPELPEIDEARASLSMAQSPLSIHRWIAHRLDGISKTYRDFQRRVLMLSDLILTALVVISLLGFFFVAAQIVRHGMAIYYDLADAFPKVMTILIVVVAALFCFLPIYYGIGPFLLFPPAAAILWQYQTRGERFLAFVFTIMLGLSPWALRMGSRLSEAGTGDTQTLYQLTRNAGDARATELVEAMVEADKDKPEAERDWHARAVLGVTYKRLGRLDDAVRTLEDARSLVPNGSADAAMMINNLGNTLFARGYLETAEKYYLVGAKALPTRAEPAFNLARLYERRGDEANAKNYIRKATQLDPSRVKVWISDTDDNLNRYVRDIDLPVEVLTQRELADVFSPTPFASRLWVVLAGPVPEMSAPLFAGVSLVLFAVLMALRRRTKLTRLCARCARPARLPASAPQPRGGQMCDYVECLFASTMPVDRRVRFELEEKVARHRAFVRWTTRVVGVLLPGLVGLLRGLPLRGILALSVTLVLILRLILPDGVLLEPFSTGSAHGPESYWIITMLVGLWATSAVRAYQLTKGQA